MSFSEDMLFEFDHGLPCKTNSWKLFVICSRSSARRSFWLKRRRRLLMTVGEKLYSLSVLELERVRNEKEEGMRWSLWNSLRGMKLEEEVRRPVCELAGVSELATGCLTRGGTVPWLTATSELDACEDLRGLPASRSAARRHPTAAWGPRVLSPFLWPLRIRRPRTTRRQ